MIRYQIIFVFVLSILTIKGSNCLAQGFDWTSSWRLPSTSPTLFIGPYTEMVNMHDYVDFSSMGFAIDCCKYGNGTANNFKNGILVEKWFKGNYSFTVKLGYYSYTSNFNGETLSNQIQAFDTNKILFVDTLRTRFSLAVKNQNVYDISLLAKSRLFETHASISGGINCIIQDGIAAQKIEEVLNPGFEREIPNTVELGSMTSFIVSPVVQIEYDIDLGSGKYAKVFANTQYSINSRSQNADWDTLIFGAGLSICFGIN
ncbi:hypothetical protein LBMAG36_11430 [Chlorobiota bacterium]|nr:hypothetical protein LBMAG36_11430 [Chlorobiota bacterium]